MDDYLNLSDKVALVTGASSGIGAATAKVFAELGAHTAISYHHNQEGAEKIRDEIARAGRKTITIHADVREAQQIRAMVERVIQRHLPIHKFEVLKVAEQSERDHFMQFVGGLP